MIIIAEVIGLVVYLDYLKCGELIRRLAYRLHLPECRDCQYTTHLAKMTGIDMEGCNI